MKRVGEGRCVVGDLGHRFGSREKYKTTRRLHTIHSDVCQLSHQARDGSKYFVTFIDDSTKFGVVYFIHANHKFLTVCNISEALLSARPLRKLWS